VVDNNDKMAVCEALPPRVKDVLRGFAKYQRPKEIAQELHLSVNTVRGYEKTAREKLGVRSTRTAAMLLLTYEAQNLTPNFWGNQNQRVAETATAVAVSGRGFSDPSAFDGEDEIGQGTASDAALPDNALNAQTAPAEADHMQNDQLMRGRSSGHIENRPDTSPVQSAAHLRLRRLSQPGWVGLVAALALGVIAAFGIGTVSLLGVFEVLQQIGGPHR